ncbi:accessory gene regulator B family protein [Paenibacillus sp. MMS18-CY102]|uniref:accessory gene regulator B family protein n=1 Tax=Paenibacillus sp. MMS18-CY102 TaxID=2682849 RepID=UPI0013657FC3|nr:hypothetical protein [Paenibacillus sp. MMS18-CY102]
MKLSESISNKIVTSIKTNDPESSSVAVLKYALDNLINLAIYMLIVLIISIITGDFVTGLIAVVAFPLLRYFSGGLHFKSVNVCNIISSLLVLICIYNNIDFWYTGVVMNATALIILVITAPANVPRSNLKQHEYKYLKMIVAVIVGLNFYFQMSVLSLVFFIQALTTLPVAQKLLDKYKL